MRGGAVVIDIVEILSRAVLSAGTWLYCRQERPNGCEMRGPAFLMVSPAIFAAGQVAGERPSSCPSSIPIIQPGVEFAAPRSSRMSFAGSPVCSSESSRGNSAIRWMVGRSPG